MEKILLVTGKLAEDSVREKATELGVDVLVLPIDVAQFMSTELAIRHFKGKEYDKIVFPGSVRADLNEVEKAIGFPCFKGPRYPSDLKLIFEELSKEVPADELFAKDAEKEYAELIKSKKPPQIIAEIVDAPLLSKEELLKRAKYYIDSGADIIDIGAIASEENSEKLAEAVKTVKSLKVPVSIDSLNPKEINAAIDAGADMVLSLNSHNIGEVKKADIIYVVIPDKNSLEENLKKAKSAGYTTLIPDPILHPPFLIADSIKSYSKFKGTLMGVGNVVELMDADSIGLNALLAALAVELDVSYLLTTENSPKTKGAVKELAKAVKLSFLAKSKGALPKDLGIDLLVAKSKECSVTPDVKAVSCEEDDSIEQDVKGFFKIYSGDGKILAVHSSGKAFEGTNAEAISKKILKEGIVSNQQHANYLGRELQKAEIALKLNRAYVQDESFGDL